MPKYHRPTTRADALTALVEGGPRARALVGGTDLLVGLRHHHDTADVLVDLKGVTDLPEPIVVTDEAVLIGPTYTMGELVTHPVIVGWFPALVEAALTVGSVAIRNRASLIGNACNASPAADTAPPLLVHGARVTISSLDGDRTASLDEFFLGPRRTLCGPGELVTRLELPRPVPGSGSAFRRLTRRRGVDLATVSVAAGVGSDGGLVAAMGAVGPRPLRTEAPGPLDLTDTDALDRALDQLVAVATPISDVRGSREYRLATLRVLTKRAVIAAADRRDPREMAS
jgi:CO/xanthine dehydrogenase FAD-binding subunit